MIQKMYQSPSSMLSLHSHDSFAMIHHPTQTYYLLCWANLMSHLEWITFLWYMALDVNFHDLYGFNSISLVGFIVTEQLS